MEETWTWEELRARIDALPRGLIKHHLKRHVKSLEAARVREEAVARLLSEAARDRYIMPPQHTQSKPDGLCSYCGQPSADLESDHIVARSLGGDNGFHNRTPACRPCNAQKGETPFLFWLMEIGGCHAS